MPAHPILGAIFFPHSDKVVSTLSVLAGFAISFIVRPIGAIIFGYIGDILGRKYALNLSVLIMACSTLIISLLPTYDQIGILAPCLMISLRVLQSLSLGGEYNGAAILVVENTEDGKKGLAGGLVTASIAIGLLLGSGMSFICVNFMEQSGWRFAFFFGGLICIGNFFIRRSFIEDSKILSIITSQKISLNHLFSHYSTSMFLSLLICGAAGVMFYTTFFYISIFLNLFQGWSLSDSFLIGLFGIATYGICTPFTGWLADKIEPTAVMKIGAILILLVLYPAFVMFTRSIGWAYFGEFLLAVSISTFQGPANFFLVSLFPPSCRFRAIAISYSLGMALMGGTAPIFLTFLSQKYKGAILAPVSYLIFISVIALVILVKFFPRPMNEKREIYSNT